MQFSLGKIGSTQVNRELRMLLSPGIPDLRTLLEKTKLMSICQINHLLSLAILYKYCGEDSVYNDTYYNLFITFCP